MIKITYFVHGTTTDNSDKLCSGWKEAMLNELGRNQAKNLGEVSKKRKDNFDIIFTSDLKRAVESAELAFPNVIRIADRRLRECNYGDLDGKHKNLVIYEEHVDQQFPNGESLQDVERRMRDFIDYLKQNFNDKKIGIVAHRAPQLSLEVITKGITWDEANVNDWRKTGDWQPGWQYIIED